MKRSEREKVFAKYNEHCAYCGKIISYDEMQVDHLIPQRLLTTSSRYNKNEINSFDNYMPSCRRCNHYKRGNSIEVFRKMIQEIPQKLYRDNYIYKVGLDYGNVLAKEQEIIFYFEKVK